MLIIIPLSKVKKVRQRQVTSLVEWGFEPRQSDCRIYIQPLCYVALYLVRDGKCAVVPSRGHPEFLLFLLCEYFPVSFAHFVTSSEPITSLKAWEWRWMHTSFISESQSVVAHACFRMTWVFIKNSRSHPRSFESKTWEVRLEGVTNPQVIWV